MNYIKKYELLFNKYSIVPDDGRNKYCYIPPKESKDVKDVNDDDCSKFSDSSGVSLRTLLKNENTNAKLD